MPSVVQAEAGLAEAKRLREEAIAAAQPAVDAFNWARSRVGSDEMSWASWVDQAVPLEQAKRLALQRVAFFEAKVRDAEAALNTAMLEEISDATLVNTAMLYRLGG